MTLQQYRDALRLFLIQESSRHNLTLDWRQPSHFLKSQVRGHRVGIMRAEGSQSVTESSAKDEDGEGELAFVLCCWISDIYFNFFYPFLPTLYPFTLKLFFYAAVISGTFFFCIMSSCHYVIAHCLPTSLSSLHEHVFLSSVFQIIIIINPYRLQCCSHFIVKCPAEEIKLHVENCNCDGNA